MDVSARVREERIRPITSASLYITALHSHYTLQKILSFSRRRQMEQKNRPSRLDL